MEKMHDAGQSAGRVSLSCAVRVGPETARLLFARCARRLLFRCTRQYEIANDPRREDTIRDANPFGRESGTCVARVALKPYRNH